MKRWIPTLLFFLFICWSIFLANSGSEGIFLDIAKRLPYGDKLGHVLLYGVLTALMIIALKFKALLLFNRPIQLGSLQVITFAFIEEVTQIFIPNRTFDLYDLYADVVGVFIFTLVAVRIHTILRNRTKSLCPTRKN